MVTPHDPENRGTDAESLFESQVLVSHSSHYFIYLKKHGLVRVHFSEQFRPNNG